jgi:hypothetical protein
MDLAPLQTAPPQTATINSLDYGLRLPLYRRPASRMLIRAVIAAMLIAAIAYSVYQISSHWPLFRLYYLQHECITHPVPPGVQIYSSAQPSVIYSNPQFDALYQSLPPSYNWPDSHRKTIPLYQGVRTPKNGAKRFIAVYAEVFLWPDPKAYDIVELTAINRPMTLAPAECNQKFSLTATSIGALDRAGDLILRAKPNVLLNSAVEDPSDGSHWTTTFDFSAYRYVDDYYLQPGGGIRINEHVFKWPIGPDGSRLASGLKDISAIVQSPSNLFIAPPTLTPTIVPYRLVPPLPASNGPIYLPSAQPQNPPPTSR